VRRRVDLHGQKLAPSDTTMALSMMSLVAPTLNACALSILVST